jgi:hypothetical protein
MNHTTPNVNLTSAPTSTPTSNTNTNSNPHLNNTLNTYLRQLSNRSENTTLESKKNSNNIDGRTGNYDLDSSISKDLNTIYTNFICSTLLKNDCILFGDFVIDFFSNNTFNFTKTIYAYAEVSLRHVIERDLYGKLYSKKTGSFTTYGGVQYTYKCIYDHNVYDITIYYLNYIQKLETQFIKETMILNIDTLTISRNEIKVLSWLNDHGEMNNLDVPLPLGNLVEDIANKQFYIYVKIKHIHQLTRIILYVNSGWKNASSTLLKEKQSLYIGKLCEICHEKIGKGQRISTLKCKHFFHKDCWHETLKQHIMNTSSDILNCPTCRKPYYMHEVL